jgi:hypothetical protein
VKRTRLLIAAALLVVASLTSTPALASSGGTVVPAQDGTLQQRIDELLRAFPGGKQIADDQIAWEKESAVITLEGGSNAKAVGTCASGSYCAWSLGSYTGTKLTFTACSAAGTSSSVAPLLTNPKSLANARNTGNVKAKNGSIVVWNLGASSGTPFNTATVTTMVCFT